MEQYDRFSRMKGGLRHLRLSAAETRRLMPGLKADGLLGAVSFDEWWVDPEALVKANIDAAVRKGADVHLSTEVLALVQSDARISGALLRGPDGREETVQAAAVVNAGGPWADRVARLAGVDVPLRLRQGVHLVFKGPLPVLRVGGGTEAGLILQAADGRYVFVLPHGDTVLVGPTDVATEQGPDDLRPTAEEEGYLASTVRGYLPDFPARWDKTLVGARPILGRGGPEKLLSREFEVFDHARDGAAGFLTVAGGKMSDFRLMAEAASDAVCRRLGRPAVCTTRRVDLAGRAVESVPNEPLPPAFLKKFLRGHPRLRELHAWAHLALGFVRHAASRFRRLSSAEDFRRHYSS